MAGVGCPFLVGNQRSYYQELEYSKLKIPAAAEAPCNRFFSEVNHRRAGCDSSFAIPAQRINRIVEVNEVLLKSKLRFFPPTRIIKS